MEVRNHSDNSWWNSSFEAHRKESHRLRFLHDSLEAGVSQTGRAAAAAKKLRQLQIKRVVTQGSLAASRLRFELFVLYMFSSDET